MLLHVNTFNMIAKENENTIHFKQRQKPNWSHNLEIVTMNGGESTSQYHMPLAVAKFTGKWQKIPVIL
jgi:pyruvate-formate lyase-activating enzyme